MILPFWVLSGALFGQTDPGPAAGIWYGQWAFALAPIALGLVFHLLTLLMAFVFIRECIRKGRFNRRSGLPFVGPIFICLGLWWSPSRIPTWVFLIPWALELTAAVSSVLVQKATHAEPT